MAIPMIAAALIAGIWMFALRDDGTAATVDADGSFAVAETARFLRLVPPVVEDGSFAVVETARFLRLVPPVVEDGSFAVAETARFLRLVPPVVDIDGMLIPADRAPIMR